MLLWVCVGILFLVLFLATKKEGFEQPAGVRYIAIGSPGYLQISQLKVMADGINVAAGKKVLSTSELSPEMAKIAVDGVSAPRPFPSIYESGEENATWALDLGKEYKISEIVFYNRSDGCGDRAAVMKMVLFDGNANRIGDTYPFNSDKIQTFQFTASTEKAGLSTPVNVEPAMPAPTAGTTPVISPAPPAIPNPTAPPTGSGTGGRCNFSTCGDCTSFSGDGVCYWNSSLLKCSDTQLQGYSRNCDAFNDTCSANPTCETCKGKKGPSGSCYWCGTQCLDPGNSKFKTETCSTAACRSP